MPAPFPSGAFFDYLMGCDLDVDNQDVKNELFAWGKWCLETTGVDGFRFDAVKHINAGFFNEWLNYMHSISKRKLFFVGEYWSTKSDSLKHFVDATQGQMMLFDAGLHFAARPISGAQALDQSVTVLIAGLVGANGGRILREGYAQVSFLGARCRMC